MNFKFFFEIFLNKEFDFQGEKIPCRFLKSIFIY